MAASTNHEQGMIMTKRLWLNCSREWTLVLQSPFVISLASGNLEPDTFFNFVSQDLRFYKCFAQALKMAKEYADDDTKDSIKLLIKEFKKHVYRIKKLGVGWTKEYPVNPATVECTGFISEASGTIAAYKLGAMLPHMQLYDFIRRQLQSLKEKRRKTCASESIHPYQNWIKCYSSKFFKISTDVAELSLNRLIYSMTGVERDNIQANYEYVMKLELHFFSSQPMVQKAVVPLFKEHNPSEYHFMIFSDFHLTCDVIGSSAFLEDIAIEKVTESYQVQSKIQFGQMPPADLRSTCELLSKDYKEKYEQWCTENILLADKGEKFSLTVLQKALKPLSVFNKRVIASGLRAGEQLILQDGCISFFQSVTEDEQISASIHVLAYCWCNDPFKLVYPSGDLHTLEIRANELIYNKSISTGEIRRKNEFPFDKAGLFGNILEMSGSDKRKKLIVYVGDSVGDLPCLLEAHIGIVFNASENLKEVASRFNITLVPLFKGLVQKQKEMVDGKSCSWKGQSGTLYTVSSWAEIHNLILGSSFVRDEHYFWTDI